MGRLIDADKLIEAIRKSTCQWAEHMWKQVVCDVINNQPTAYDVKKVVAELEDAKFLMPPENDNHYADNGLFLEDAIDIVRKGGVE